MARVYYGGYGHNPKPGKQYAYIGSNKYSVGQNVVAPVTHYISGKNFKTMFTIQDQHEMGSAEAENTIIELENMRKTLKSLDGTNVMELPGAKDYASAMAWKEAADDIAAGDYAAAERLKSRQTENPTKATAVEFKARTNINKAQSYYEQHEQMINAIRKYQSEIEQEQYKRTPEAQYKLHEAMSGAFERYKNKSIDDKTFKREITRALTHYSPIDYYEMTDAEHGVDLFLENMQKQRQLAKERLLSRRR